MGSHCVYIFRRICLKFIPVLLLIFISVNASASIDCERPIKRVFTGYTLSGSKIHVEHGDGYAASVVQLPYVNGDEKIVDRILSTILAAHMGSKKIEFRYLKGINNSSASCQPTVNQITEAVWLK